ncbi:hypothetical protein [Trueperella bernardiae]|uniref:hypothetical protein n=1 Tax=Trueperella bernardiae TaxID=59561 RepID=UPI001180E977|nr:hypothetical protein [Trueperella bernardiae]
MANLGTQEDWTPLTKTWHEARKRGLARFTWIFKDGPHRFQLVDVEEANKIYYLFNARRGGPTPKNLAKTRLLIGIDAAEYCQRHGRSTHWSPTPKDFSLTQWNQLLSELRPH